MRTQGDTLRQRLDPTRRLWLFVGLWGGLALGCSNANPISSPAFESSAEPVPTRAIGQNEPSSVAPGETSSPTQPQKASASDDWPQFLGPRGDAISRESDWNLAWDSAGPPVLWRTAVGLGYSAPVVLDGWLIVQHRQGEVESVDCLDAETADLMWRYDIATDYVCKYPYSNGPYATPTISGDFVYAITAGGELIALERQTGNLVWSRELLSEFNAPTGAFGYGNSPRLCHDRLVLNVGGRPNAGIVALAAATGETLWTATAHGRSYASAVSAEQHGKTRLYQLTEMGLVSLDWETGDVLWSYPFGVQGTPERTNAVTPLVIGNRIVLCSGPGPGTVVLDIQPDGSYREVWKQRRVLDAQYTNLLAYDGCLYGVTSRAAALVRCVDVQTGNQLWEYASDLCRAHVVLAGGRLLFLGEHGHLACLRPGRSGPQVDWITSEPVLQGPCYSAPALARGRLYLRNEREVIALDLRSPAAKTTTPTAVLSR